jgi:hypothetical protein
MSALSPISLFSPLISPRPADFLETTANASLLAAATQNNLPELRALAVESGRALAAIGVSIPDFSAQDPVGAIQNQVLLDEPIEDVALRLFGLEVFRIQLRVLELLSGDLGISDDNALDLLTPIGERDRAGLFFRVNSDGTLFVQFRIDGFGFDQELTRPIFTPQSLTQAFQLGTGLF